MASYNLYDKETKTLIPIAGVEKFPAQTGTRAEFEAKKDLLPAGTVFTTTDEFEETGEKMFYSTEETFTNKIWIDGKPIYRKMLINTETIEADVFLWGGLQNEIQNMNISTMVYVAGVQEGNKSYRSMAFNHTNEGGGFYCVGSGLLANSYIICEYTKTTN